MGKLNPYKGTNVNHKNQYHTPCREIENHTLYREGTGKRGGGTEDKKPAASSGTTALTKY